MKFITVLSLPALTLLLPLISMDNDPLEQKNQIAWNPYRCCPEPYAQWSCQERSQTSALCFLSCCITLAAREVASGITVCDSGKSCVDIQKFVWCSQEAWFPCNTPSTFCCVAANLVSGCTLACPVAGVCSYAPWFKKNGCNCCVTIEPTQTNEMSNY